METPIARTELRPSYGPPHPAGPPRGAPGALDRLVATLKQWQLLIALVSGFLGGAWSPWSQLAGTRAEVARIRVVTDALGKKACIDLPITEAQKLGLPCEDLLRGKYFVAPANYISAATAAEVPSR